MEQAEYLQSFIFPGCSIAFTKHCAIVCLNRSLLLTNIAMGQIQRSIYASIIDTSGNVLCHIINVYIHC
jgi:hypothetical protein